MPKGIPKQKYTGEFKQHVVETMHREKLSDCETARQFGINCHKSVSLWERIYLEEGPGGLYIERRGSRNKGLRHVILPKQTEDDLIAEVQRLRAENAYLKKLKALVLEEERLNKRRK